MIRFRSVLLATCLVGVVAAPATAAQSQVKPETQAARPPAATTEDDAPRQICRMEKQTGSQRSTRVCRSVDQIRRDQEEAADAMRSRGSRSSRESI